MNAKARKSTKPSKSTTSSTKLARSVPQTEPGSTLEGPPNNLVRIHDLMSFAAVSIPDELRGILGDEAYERNLEELEHYEILFILREPQDVVYLKMPVIAVSSEPRRPSTQEPVKAPTPPKAKAKAKAKTKAKTKAKPKAVEGASKPVV